MRAAADMEWSLLLVCPAAHQGIQVLNPGGRTFCLGLCDVLLQYVPLLRRSFQMYEELERETKQVNRVVGSMNRLL